MHKSSVIGLLIVLLAATGSSVLTAEESASSRQGVAFGQERLLADKLVGQLFAAYQNYSRPHFESLIADDFSPMRVKFFSRLESRVYRGKVLEIHYVLNEVLTSRDRLIAGFSWEKKTVPVGSGKPVLRRGKARAVFSQKKGKWQLMSMGGSSPF